MRVPPHMQAHTLDSPSRAVLETEYPPSPGMAVYLIDTGMSQ